MPPEPLLEVIDDAAPAELFGEACKIGAAKGWYFGHGSRDGDSARFWKMDLEGIAVFDSIWASVREQCERKAGMPLRVLRQYANGHTYGLGGQPHLDDHRPGSFTLLYYPMQEWQDGWDGETVFYDERGEIALSVRPRPNRAILFDSRIPHAGRAPSRSCSALRVTVAYKLQAAEEEKHTVEENSTEGAESLRTVQIPETHIRTLVAERLSKLGETIRLPGFRPGKIPMPVLEQRYGADARAEIVKRLAADAAKEVPEGSLVATIDIQQGDGEVEFRMTVVHLRQLPEPDLSRLTLERLMGLDTDAQEQHIKEQMLDHLERSYTFTLPGLAVEREFAAILEAAKEHGPATGEDAAEFRRIAERRVRVGIVVAELARRYGIGSEDLVLQRLISQAGIQDRPATIDELQELA